MSKDLAEPSGGLRRGFFFGSVSWPRVAVLFVIWVSIKLVLARSFAHNSRAEDYDRILENIGRLKPRLWPALLNICGCMLPIIVILRRDIRPLRFRNYLWILPFWFAIMFYRGVILETRIYGELCPYVAVARLIIMELHVETLRFGREVCSVTNHATNKQTEPLNATASSV